MRRTYAAPWVTNSTPCTPAPARVSEARNWDTWPWMTLRARAGGSCSHRAVVK